METMIMRSRALACTLLVATTFAAGCGANPRAASKENFAHAIDAKLGTTAKLCLGGENALFSDQPALPTEMFIKNPPVTSSNPPNVTLYDATIHRQLEALVTAGLATKRTTTVKVQEYLSHYSLIPTTVNVRADVYDRGPAFAKYANGTVNPGAATSVSQLCFASLQVDHIDNYSEPSQIMSATVSQVYYHAKAVGVADWTSMPSMRAAFPAIDEQLQKAGTNEESAMVVLMNDGWKAQ